MPKPSQFIVAALLGAIVAVVVGYFVYVGPGGDGTRTFTGWLFHPHRVDALYWAVAGLICGAGVRYAFR
jgi:hypothetical protein